MIDSSAYMIVHSILNACLLAPKLLTNIQDLDVLTSDSETLRYKNTQTHVDVNVLKPS